MNLDEIQQIFFQECEEGLATMEASFAALRADAHDTETINTIFRAVHSIKGGAGAFGHERLQGFAHRYETLLDLVRAGTLVLTPALLGTIVAAFDMLTDHVAAARETSEPPADAAMTSRLAAACDGGAAPPAVEPTLDAESEPAVNDGFDDIFAMFDEPEAPAPWRVDFYPAGNALDHGAEPLLLLRELAAMGADDIRADLSLLPDLAALAPDQVYLGWSLTMPGTLSEDDIREVFEFTDGHALRIERVGAVENVEEEEEIVVETPPPPVEITTPILAIVPASEPTPSRPVAGAVQTIRVDLDKLDRLVNLVGELVITQAMLAQRLSEHGLNGIPQMSDLDHLTRDLQESTMAIRAQPMKTVFSRVPRIIRELEIDTGKRVRLEVEGEMTEVDKTVVERIGEPLTHLIRNAVDHGLEIPADRLAGGKPEEGVVKLAASHHSGRIVITVADDGRGIDRTRVRAKAVERGIIPADALLSDEDIDNLIFAPGFSTAATVSNISGRGVGLDVVRKSVQALGGRIAIHSHAGQGSCFSLSLPLTLAVLDGMIVTVGDQNFVIPLGHIVESVRPAPGAVNVMSPGSALFDVRGSYVPVRRVADQLGIAGAESDPSKAVLIVVESDGGQAVLMVDTIQDQRQVVVKSLEANYEAIQGLAGATILGDGRVALILDVDALIARSRRMPTGLAA